MADQREYWRKYHSERRASRVKDGLCYDCGDSPIVEGKKRCLSCIQRMNEKNRVDRANRRSKGLCHKCNQPAVTGLTHCERHLTLAKERWRLIRQRVLDHYGRSCVCCGESIEEFLAIDHTNGGGNGHRKELGASRGHTRLLSGSSFYKWLIDQGFPEGFQILCHNCNQAKALYGACPHRRM